MLWESDLLLLDVANTPFNADATTAMPNTRFDYLQVGVKKPMIVQSDIGRKRSVKVEKPSITFMVAFPCASKALAPSQYQ